MSPRLVGLALRTLLRGRSGLLWAVVLTTLAAALLGLGLAALGDDPIHSVWEHAGTPARWVPFVVGVMTVSLVLPTYLAFGFTRRTVSAAGAGAGLVLSAAIGLYMAGGYLLERAAFAVTGRSHQLDGEHLFGSAAQAHLVFIEYTLAVAAYLISGWLIGAGYYRFGGLRGSLLLPLGLLPMVVVENLLGTGRWTGIGPPTVGAVEPHLPTPLAVGLALVALAVSLAALYALIRAIPIRTRR